jgi:hypothetical protein
MNMNRLAERKLLELQQKLRALDDEFRRWHEQSEADMPAQKHQSQVLAITVSLNGLRNRIHERVDSLAGSPEIVGESVTVQRLILALYRVWEFFRSKLEQRSVSAFRAYLATADELVWQCYDPLRKLAFPDLTLVPGKEPPLVFLNGGWSPFVAHRKAAFQAEDVPRELINDRTVKRILESQPISVIGVPWYQIAHLPEALVLLHETGHIVEADFGLKGQLLGLLEKALRDSKGASRQQLWATWLPEVFADLYGCLAGGPTFADTLVDFLVSSRTSIETDRSTERHGYPSAYLRVLLAAAALDELGFKKEAERIKAEWRNLYPAHAMAEFEPDLPPIAATVLSGCTVEGQKLMDQVAFTSEMQEAAELARDNLSVSEPLAQPDIRILFATARLAYQENPRAYIEEDWGKTILSRAVASLKPERRAGEEVLDKSDRKLRNAVLERLGSKLFDELLPPKV